MWRADRVHPSTLRAALKLAIALLAVGLLLFCLSFAEPPAVPQYGFQIAHIYPHDRQAFTQGLEFRQGFLYEGTGLNGRSTLRKDDLQTGKVLQEIELPARFFGEGITLLNGQIIQLTWQSQVGYVYEQKSFRILREFSYPGEGWGLTNDGRELYMSDGTAQIRRLNPVSLAEDGRFTVHDGATEIHELNELEWVEGEIYANVWGTDRIARISPSDGRVVGWIDLTELLPLEERLKGADVLNGIAYDAATRRLFVTGKLWPQLFEITLIRRR